MKYLSLFSGIGGFEKGIAQACPEWECVGFSEIDKYARKIYQKHYPNHTDYGNIKDVNAEDLPDFNLLVGGFPCQAFSVAGKRQGFDDTRGTLFFDIARILRAKRPEWVLLENVKGLLSHKRGDTFAIIYEVLAELGYTVGWEVVNSCHFGVPQSRERIFIIGHLTERGGRAGEVLPIREAGGEADGKERSGGVTGITHNKGELRERDVSTAVDANYYKGVDNHGQRTLVRSGTWRTHKDGQGFREVQHGLRPTIPARAREDGSGQPVILTHYGHKGKPTTKHNIVPTLKAQSHGHEPMVASKEEPSFTLTSQDKHGAQIGTSIRRLTPVECERLQGFPDGWTEGVSDTQRYKCLGNAVTVNVVEAIIRKIDTVNLLY